MNSNSKKLLEQIIKEEVKLVNEAPPATDQYAWPSGMANADEAEKILKQLKAKVEPHGANPYIYSITAIVQPPKDLANSYFSFTAGIPDGNEGTVNAIPTWVLKEKSKTIKSLGNPVTIIGSKPIDTRTAKSAKLKLKYDTTVVTPSWLKCQLRWRYYDGLLIIEQLLVSNLTVDDDVINKLRDSRDPNYVRVKAFSDYLQSTKSQRAMPSNNWVPIATIKAGPGGPVLMTNSEWVTTAKTQDVTIKQKWQNIDKRAAEDEKDRAQEWFGLSLGLVPGQIGTITDVINGIVYGARDKWVDVAFTAIGLIPAFKYEIKLLGRGARKLLSKLTVKAGKLKTLDPNSPLYKKYFDELVEDIRTGDQATINFLEKVSQQKGALRRANGILERISKALRKSKLPIPGIGKLESAAADKIDTFIAWSEKNMDNIDAVADALQRSKVAYHPNLTQKGAQKIYQKVLSSGAKALKISSNIVAKADPTAAGAALGEVWTRIAKDRPDIITDIANKLDSTIERAMKESYKKAMGITTKTFKLSSQAFTDKMTSSQRNNMARWLRFQFASNSLRKPVIQLINQTSGIATLFIRKIASMDASLVTVLEVTTENAKKLEQLVTTSAKNGKTIVSPVYDSAGKLSKVRVLDPSKLSMTYISNLIDSISDAFLNPAVSKSVSQFATQISKLVEESVTTTLKNVDASVKEVTQNLDWILYKERYLNILSQTATPLMATGINGMRKVGFAKYFLAVNKYKILQPLQNEFQFVVEELTKPELYKTPYQLKTKEEASRYGINKKTGRAYQVGEWLPAGTAMMASRSEFVYAIPGIKPDTRNILKVLNVDDPDEKQGGALAFLLKHLYTDQTKAIIDRKRQVNTDALSPTERDIIEKNKIDSARVVNPGGIVFGSENEEVLPIYRIAIQQGN
jgi:hypothetical protein